ncbi:MAG TPA: Na+/H+ antiporter NhaA [Solirubrobacteraceae bacterium]|nr:Na+/H+ antiporter NhaA [Solirubrobacteraceae bacterium]
MADDEQQRMWLARTAWSRNVSTPLLRTLRTETGSAIVLLAAALIALAWVNADPGSYRSVWETRLAISVGADGITQTLRAWIDDGLMVVFFFVVGLEARREFDIGELRERRRVVVPMLAGLGGMLVPVAIYLAFNAGTPASNGWGAAMSTDTAFALGMLALVGPRVSGRLRSFMLTVVVVDDVVALIVIATVYTHHVALAAALVALGAFAAVLAVRAAGVRSGAAYALLGLVMWVAVFESGIDPLIVGLAMGLLTVAYSALRSDLERASVSFRSFREQPTAQLARSARLALESAISPNDRLAAAWHPWSSYVVVPLFALANAGIRIDGGFLVRAFGSGITLGILVGYVVGKPAGIFLTAQITRRLSRDRLRPPVGWAAALGGSATAGIGFTVALLIATIAFRGAQLAEAKLGILSAALCASLLSWLIFRAVAMLPAARRARALAGRLDVIVDLVVDVDPERDHIRGPEEAVVTLVEYGDLECPYCGQAETVLRELLADHGDLRYVWRHLPLTDVHPHAQLAAEATEAAATQGAFWEMHDLLFEHQDALRPVDLRRYAAQLALDTASFEGELLRHVHAGRVAEDVDSADLSGVSGTPTFFINGRRHYGAYDIDTLSAAVRAAKTAALARM